MHFEIKDVHDTERKMIYRGYDLLQLMQQIDELLADYEDKRVSYELAVKEYYEELKKVMWKLT